MMTFRIIRTDRNVDASSLLGESLLLGQSAACALQLNHHSVKPLHAGIKWHNGAYWLSAFSGATVFVNAEAVEHAALRDGDTLRVGAYRLQLVIGKETLQISVELRLEAAQTAAAKAPPVMVALAADRRALETYWAKRLPEAHARSVVRNTERPPRVDLQARWPRALPLGSVLLLAAAALLAVFFFPRVYAPGPLSAAHARKIPADGPPLANRYSAGACASCHTLTGSMQQQCVACHTTPSFQADIATAHTKLGLACRTCHPEHRGAEFKTALTPNSLCLDCHRDRGGVLPANGKTLAAPHGPAVAYPVRDGLWSWDGVSQLAWQRRALPGHTADYNLREQFHLLHTQGRPQGRAQCADCHTGGLQGAALKSGVREACAQCHRVAEPGAAQPQPALGVLCLACHTQHGAEKDLRASTRK